MADDIVTTLRSLANRWTMLARDYARASKEEGATEAQIAYNRGYAEGYYKAATELAALIKAQEIGASQPRPPQPRPAASTQPLPPQGGGRRAGASPHRRRQAATCSTAANTAAQRTSRCACCARRASSHLQVGFGGRSDLHPGLRRMPAPRCRPEQGQQPARDLLKLGQHDAPRTGQPRPERRSANYRSQQRQAGIRTTTLSTLLSRMTRPT